MDPVVQIGYHSAQRAEVGIAMNSKPGWATYYMELARTSHSKNVYVYIYV